MNKGLTKEKISEILLGRIKLVGEWCTNNDENDKCEFHSYPQDGECWCGVYKHHVHCHHGYIIQVG